MQDNLQSAFPNTHSGLNRGMNLRDYFAGQCLMVMDKFFRTGDQGIEIVEDDAEHVASMAYRVADAMLRERQKP